jgi:large subunit ribosomal protein L33
MFAMLFHERVLDLEECLVSSRGIIIFATPISRKMAKKGNRVQVILECTEHKNSGMPGTSRYITTKNRKNTPDRIEIKKFNPVLRKYTLHKEIK